MIRSTPLARPLIEAVSEQIARLGAAFWVVVVLGSMFTLARFSEAFLILSASDQGLPLMWAPPPQSDLDALDRRALALIHGGASLHDSPRGPRPLRRSARAACGA